MRVQKWVSMKLCLLQLLRRGLSWVRPNFSNHWGNWLFVPALAFALGFFSTSLFAADPEYYTSRTLASLACNDYKANYVPPDVNLYSVQGCSDGVNYGYPDSIYFRVEFFSNGSYSLDPGESKLFYYSTDGSCPDGSTNDGSGHCLVPTPPQNCSELASQSPDPFYASVPGTSSPLSVCNQGCGAVSAGGVSVTAGEGSDATTGGQFVYDGTDCPGGSGYDPLAGVITDPLLTESPKNCYGSDGSYLGQVSFNVNCPNLVNCYSSTDGSFQGTASDPQSCAEGTVTKAELSPELQNAVDTQQATTSTQVADDGSVTESTTVESTQVGADGSKVYKKVTTTCTTDPQGNKVCTETTSEEGAACEGPDCPVDEMTDSEMSKQVNDFISSGKLAAIATDQYGQMSGIYRGEINLQDQLDMQGEFGDYGSAGSCPAPYSLHFVHWTIPFNFDIICEFAGMIRAIVIFASVWLSMAMVSQTVLGTSWRRAN